MTIAQKWSYIVQAAVIVHAGANLQLEAGSLTYHIQEDQDVLPIIIGTVCGVLVLAGIGIIIGEIAFFDHIDLR